MTKENNRMDRSSWIDATVKATSGHLRNCNNCTLRRHSKKGAYLLPNRKSVHDVLDTIVGILFPGCHGHGPMTDHNTDSLIENQLKSLAHTLQEQVAKTFEYECELNNCSDCNNCEDKAMDAARHLIELLPDVQKILQKDIQAAYDGDPAAKSSMEVVMSYPGIQAISIFRIAHVLYKEDVPLIPRIMTELAHSRTGIDIHPGATIGPGFFIDHGTGVVIGETSIIGNHVKIYQGVTLGAMSFPVGTDGRPVKGIKRHPNVENNVTIYAEATILGDVTIGTGSTIGGNVWLTHSVPPNSKVNNVQPGPEITT